MGPIQMFLLGFEDFQATGGIADELAALSDAGTIRIIHARFLRRESADDVVAVRVSDLDDYEREGLRAAVGALGVAELGLSATEIGELADELAVGDALLLLVIENVSAAGLADAIRDAGVVSAQQDYLSVEGLVALGAMLSLDVALDT